MLQMNNIHAVDKDLYLDFAIDMPSVPLRNTFVAIPSTVCSRPCGRTDTQLQVVSDARCMTVGSLWKGTRKRGRGRSQSIQAQTGP